ncbi:hypothetical protein TI39_contig4149g00024 [Zymoseptoria brevis]|uniref:Cell wall galactomannoprotein n=1 Tax=Zymoseptoria brevis TaxID=1047168 RepID=A0A0F4GC70_9PEZI|nr:hypothetical protein TI39_contig4149g00024 [Zymoseptoria brevis]
MKLFNLLVLAPLALAAPLTKRQSAQATNQGITNIDTAVRELITQLNAYQGGILESRPVIDASVNIHKVNRDAKTAADASRRFNQQDSQVIVKNVMDSVGVSIPQAVEIIKAKKPVFDEAQVSSLVKATIDLLQYDHRTFSASVGAKLTLTTLPGGLAGAGGIDASLTGASLYYTVP